MTVAIDTSTNGKFTMISSTNATLATCLAEVLDELETHNKPSTKTDFVFTNEGTNFVLVAICKN